MTKREAAKRTHALAQQYPVMLTRFHIGWQWFRADSREAALQLEHDPGHVVGVYDSRCTAQDVLDDLRA